MKLKEAKEIVTTWEKQLDKFPEMKDKVEEARTILAKHYLKVFRKMR
jgi:hypothetical protein